MNRRPLAVALLTLTVGLAPAGFRAESAPIAQFEVNLTPQTASLGPSRAGIAQNYAISAQKAGAAPVLRQGATGNVVRLLQHALNENASNVCWWVASCLAGYRVAVDGRFGPKTARAVEMFQAQQGLVRDGIVGPKTWARLKAPLDPADVARAALRAGGATANETALGVKLCKRESGCRIGLHVYKTSTRDDSCSAWMFNFYGKMRVDRERWLGTCAHLMHSWPNAVRGFLKMGRESGWCHWSKETNYCAG